MQLEIDWRLIAGIGAIGAAIVVASYAPHGARPTICQPAARDSTTAVRLAVDTMRILRGKPQAVTSIRAVAGGFRVRTEDAEHGAFHDGGVVLFDCAAHVSLVWLDGG